MKKPIAVMTALGATVLLTAGACQQQDPCRDERPASQALIDTVRDNPQIEVEQEGYNEAECVLTPGGQWVDEAELEEGEDD